jgi:3-(3-hydroxy-phenyl)propionate hydroxylase
MNLDSPVIISGAGPVGLITALILAQSGISSIVLESEAELTLDLRAGTYHPPTLEMLDKIGVTAEMLKVGIKVPFWQSCDLQQGLIAEWDLGLLRNDTAYPYRLHLEQHRLTPIVLERLTQHPRTRILFSHTLLGFTQDAEGVTVEVETPNGKVSLRSEWLIGADGGRSKVRKAAEIEFAGYTWPERYSVLSTTFDFARLGYRENAYISDPDQWVAVFKMPDLTPEGLWRMTMPVAAEVSEVDALAGPYAQRAIHRVTGSEGNSPYPLIHQSIYNVHQRVATHLRKERVLLAGDAAHVNNPLGGFGLNSGIHDAFNLSEKLIAVFSEHATPTLLDQYHRQRHTVNVEYVQELSVKNKQNLEERDPLQRNKRFKELREINANPDKARNFLLNSSMINSIARANAIH